MMPGWSTDDPPIGLFRAVAGRAAIFVGLLLSCLAPFGALLWPEPGLAQQQTVPFLSAPPPPANQRQGPADDQMLVQADEIHYDYTNDRVSAVGNVQIYYAGSTLEADKVVYDKKLKRLRAEGNVRLVESSGQVTYGAVMDLSDDYRDGFVDSLKIDTVDRTHFAAARGSRSEGRISVFESGVYTACEPCKDDPKKPPLWQVKAARIIHDKEEKMIYFEDARLEFFGVPVAYSPYFSTPDPTVKRKSGFLIPTFSNSTNLGFGVGIPYFWAIAPSYDLTLYPMIYTRQGPWLGVEWRQRLESGSYSLRLSGINQWDKSAFAGTTPSGVRTFRGAIDSSGSFSITDQWTWGWDVRLPTDTSYYSFYDRGLVRQQQDLFKTTVSEGISDLFLSGRGDRSYFDARSIYFYGFAEGENQYQIPVIHPVIDYDYTFGKPVLGGELSFRSNLTSLSRKTADFEPVSALAFATGLCAVTSPDPAVTRPANCAMRGIPGTYTRFSAEAQWRKTYTDRFGQMFTPFASLRADAASADITNDPAVSNFMPVGHTDVVRAMPTIGMEYRYPFIGVQSWGTQTIEPIAQVILRPDESSIGKLPNEDSQSLIFDTSNLFKVDKFSGWDRVEGGGRANVGIQYTAQFNKAGYANALFGQSYQLFGLNSFAVRDPTNTGLDSGLDSNVSDYVASASYVPNSIYSLTSRFAFDHNDFTMKRFEFETAMNFQRWRFTTVYGSYAPQPDRGFPNRREGILSSASLYLATNWVLNGSMRYDLTAGQFTTFNVGLSYVDECTVFTLAYENDYFANTTQPDTRVLLQISLRTLGGYSFNQTVASSNNN